MSFGSQKTFKSKTLFYYFSGLDANLVPGWARDPQNLKKNKKNMKTQTPKSQKATMQTKLAYCQGRCPAAGVFNNSPPPFRVQGVTTLSQRGIQFSSFLRFEKQLPQMSNIATNYSPKGHPKSQKIVPNPPHERMARPSHRIPEKSDS